MKEEMKSEILTKPKNPIKEITSSDSKILHRTELGVNMYNINIALQQFQCYYI